MKLPLDTDVTELKEKRKNQKKRIEKWTQLKMVTISEMIDTH